MIDQELLKDIGFVRGKGFDHEVWVYDGFFWVHYDGKFGGMKDRQIDGKKTSRKKFFKLFLGAMRAEWVDSQPREFED